jgi:hypothetical protein
MISLRDTATAVVEFVKELGLVLLIICLHVMFILLALMSLIAIIYV